jgi:hypothetical protein
MIDAAWERGVNRAAQILAESDMISADEFAKFHRRFARGCPCEAPRPNINRKEYAHAIYASVAQIFFFAVTRVTQSIPGSPYKA